MPAPSPSLRTACLGSALILLSACGTTEGSRSSAASGEVEDPAEPVNRGVFAANQFLHRNLVAPVARAYRDNLPEAVRSSVGNFTGNLHAPLDMAADVKCPILGLHGRRGARRAGYRQRSLRSPGLRKPYGIQFPGDAF